MKILIPLFLITVTLTTAAPSEAAQTRISCDKTTVSKIKLPTGPSGAGDGRIAFADGRSARLSYAISGATDLSRLRVGDRTLVCADMKPMTAADHYRPIAIIDYAANLIFTSDMGPEGA